jgi:hypothetical protein
MDCRASVCVDTDRELAAAKEQTAEGCGSRLAAE